jgi:hypothetical protein
MRKFLVPLAIAAILVGCVQAGVQPNNTNPTETLPGPTTGGNIDMSTPAYPEPERPTSSDATGPASTPLPNPLDAIPGEENMKKAGVFIDSVEARILESFPPQVVLHIQGSLPTPCNKLRATLAEPDAQNNIQIELYSLVDPNTACIQVIQPFETNIPLGAFQEAGKYTVLINGEQKAEFTIH